MRPAEALLLVLLCGSQTIEATEKNKSSSRKLTGKQEAIALVKRQEFSDEPFCEEGYYRCSPIWGGGCCMIGRQCASPDCPALGWRPSVIPNAIDPTPVYPDIPDRFFDEPVPSDFMPMPSDELDPEESPTPTEFSEPTSTEEAEESTEVESTTAPRTTSPRTTSKSSRQATETADRTVDSDEMRTGSSTATPVPAVPQRGLMTKGAVVGIAFAGITGAVILGFAIWRMILGKKLPKRKPGGGGGGSGGGGGGGGGGRSSKKPIPVMVFGTKPGLITRLNPWAKKSNWIEDQQRQETAERNGRESAMGLTGAIAPTGLYDAPPQQQRGLRGEPLTPGPITPGLASAGLAPAPHERTGLMDDDDDDDRRARHYERSYRSVESFDDDDEMDQRGLFASAGSPRSAGGPGAAAATSPGAPVAPTSPNAPPASWPVPEGMPSSQYRPTSYGYSGTGGARDGPGFPEK